MCKKEQAVRIIILSILFIANKIENWMALRGMKNSRQRPVYEYIQTSRNLTRSRQFYWDYISHRRCKVSIKAYIPVEHFLDFPFWTVVMFIYTQTSLQVHVVTYSTFSKFNNNNRELIYVVKVRGYWDILQQPNYYTEWKKHVRNIYVLPGNFSARLEQAETLIILVYG